MSVTPSQPMTNSVWLGLLDVEREYLYFVRLADRMRRIHTATTATILFGSSGAAIATFVAVLGGATHVPSAALALVNALVATAAVWSRTVGHADKAAVASKAADDLDPLRTRWRRLWTEMSSMDQAALLTEYDRLRTETSLASSAVPRELPLSDRLNEKCAADVYENIKAEFATP